jgi:hypothetical protein
LGSALKLAKGENVNLMVAVDIQPSLATQLGFGSAAIVLFALSFTGLAYSRRKKRSLLAALSLVALLAACSESGPINQPSNEPLTYQLSLTSINNADNTKVQGLPLKGTMLSVEP